MTILFSAAPLLHLFLFTQYNDKLIKKDG